MPLPRDLFTLANANTACSKTCQHSGLLTPSDFCLLAATETLWLKLPVKYVLKPRMPHRINCVVVTQTDKLVKACALSWAQEKEVWKDLTARGVAGTSVLILQTSQWFRSRQLSFLPYREPSSVRGCTGPLLFLLSDFPSTVELTRKDRVQWTLQPGDVLRAYGMPAAVGANEDTPGMMLCLRE